jgi:hypothetical protein
MRSRALWLVALAGGATLLLTGLGSGLLFLAIGFLDDQGLTLTETLVAASVAGGGLFFGIPLMVHGWAGWQGRSSGAFRPALTGWLWPAFPILLGLGTLVSSSSYSVWLLPPIHILAMAFPPLLVLGTLGLAISGPVSSWRETLTAAFGGGALALGVSMFIEGLLGVVLFMAVAVVVAMTPNGQEMITGLLERLQDPSGMAGFADLAELLVSLPVVLVLLGMFSILIPLVEEAVKVLAPGIAARGLHPQPGRAFWLGVAAGAGFALGENMLNGALGGMGGWTASVLARCGATLMHCATGGLVGWGWGEWWRSRRPLYLPGVYLTAMAIHGVWNALSIGTVVLGAASVVYKSGWPAYAASMGIWLTTGLLISLSLLFALGLLVAARRLSGDVDITSLPSPAQGANQHVGEENVGPATDLTSAGDCLPPPIEVACSGPQAAPTAVSASAQAPGEADFPIGTR